MNNHYKSNSCFYCNKQHKIFNKDHVIPKSKGGKFTVKTCLTCNNKKANFSLFEFYLIGGLSKELFEKTANFVKNTRPQKEYEQLFSFSCFESKIKLGYFQKLINLNRENLNFEIEDDDNIYLKKFKNIQDKFKANNKTFYKLSDYFIYLDEKPISLTPDRILHYKKIIIKSKSISEEIINYIIYNHSNYFQVISKINNQKLKNHLENSFSNKFNDTYDENYLKKAILEIKNAISNIEKIKLEETFNLAVA